MLLRRRQKKYREVAEKRASSAILKDVPRGIYDDINVGKLFFMHLSKEVREPLKQLGIDASYGLRQVVLAKLLKVRYMPTETISYSFTRNDILKSLLIDVGSPQEMFDIMNSVQNWKADTYIGYESTGARTKIMGFDRIIIAEDKTRTDRTFIRMAEDLNDINTSGIYGYLQAIKVAGRLTEADKVFLLSTLRMLDEAIRFGTEQKAPVQTYGFKDGKPVLKPASLPKWRRPLFDGYVKARFDEEFRNRLDKAVKEALEKHAGNDEVKSVADNIWDEIKEAVFAFAPAWYNAFAFDAREYLPEHIAKAVAEVAKMRVKLSNLRDKLEKGKELTEEEKAELGKMLEIFGKDQASAEKIEKVLDALAPEDLGSFVRSRLPYVIYAVGKSIGWAFDLRKIFRYVGDGDAVEKSSKLLEYGVVLPPKEAGQGDLLDTLKKLGEGGPLLTKVSAYAFYYSMGIPVTRVFRCGGVVATVMNVHYMLENPDILDTEVEMASQAGERIKTTVGREIFEAFDRAIRDFADVAVKAGNAGELWKHGSLYRSILYIFSDVDLAIKKKDGKIYEDSVIAKITDNIESAITNLLYIGFRTGEVEGALRRYERKLEKNPGANPPRKLRDYFGEVDSVRDTLNEIRAGILSLAQIPNPQYVEELGKRSEEIYEALLNKLDGKPVEVGVNMEEAKKKLLSGSALPTPGTFGNGLVRLSPYALSDRLLELMVIIDHYRREQEQQKQQAEAKKKQESKEKEEEEKKEETKEKGTQAPKRKEEKKEETEEAQTPEKETAGEKEAK